MGYAEINQRTHGKTIKILESASTRKLIVLPRGSFKSSLASVAYPVWTLLNDPDARILIDSELYTNSRNFLREIKAHLEHSGLPSVFGPFKDRFGWRENEITIRHRCRRSKEASITCGGIGTEKTGQHYTTIIMDDMNGPTNSLTKEGRQKVIDHYRYMTAILEPGGTIVVIGTRYAEDDLIGWILSNETEGLDVKPER